MCLYFLMFYSLLPHEIEIPFHSAVLLIEKHESFASLFNPSFY
jgi:hypothetical protein